MRSQVSNPLQLHNPPAISPQAPIRTRRRAQSVAVQGIVQEAQAHRRQSLFESNVSWTRRVMNHRLQQRAKNDFLPLDARFAKFPMLPKKIHAPATPKTRFNSCFLHAISSFWACFEPFVVHRYRHPKLASSESEISR